MTGRHPLSGGILFDHWRNIPAELWRWPNFSPAEVACRHCGEAYFHEPTMDAAQRLRDDLGRPVRLNSAHRCWIHNLAVGGAPKSAHKFIALDISRRGHGRRQLLDAMRRAGFGSIGLYQTFIHGDLRPGRFWFGSEAAKADWSKLL